MIPANELMASTLCHSLVLHIIAQLQASVYSLLQIINSNKLHVLPGENSNVLLIAFCRN